MPREMRGRFLLREFWSDVELQTKLNPEERLFLIGLWMLTDDAGWLELDVPFVASQVFPYLDRVDREQRTRDTVAKLVKLKKVVRYRCGHGFIAAAAKYKRPGRPGDSSVEVMKAHNTESLPNHSGMNGSEYTPDLTSPDLTSNLTLPDPRAPAGARSREEVTTTKVGADDLPAHLKTAPWNRHG